MAQTNLTSDQMTDEEYRRRYIAHLTTLLGDREGSMATEMAEDDYDDLPRAEMAAEWQNDPEGAAAESFTQYKDFHDDDDEEPFEVGLDGCEHGVGWDEDCGACGDDVDD